MTTNDIKQVCIQIAGKDGSILAGSTEDPILIKMIVSQVQFVRLDPDKVKLDSIKNLL